MHKILRLSVLALAYIIAAQINAQDYTYTTVYKFTGTDGFGYEEETVYDTTTQKIIRITCCLVDAPTASGNFVVPQKTIDKSTNETHRVEAIGKSVFLGNQYIKSVIIPQGMREIREFAFDSSTLEQISIPSTVISIERGAFRNTPLTSVTLPSGLKRIPEDLFAICTELAHIDIPSTVTEIGSQAFYNTNLTQVTIPESVTNIGNSAFSQTPIKSIKLPNNLQAIPPSLFKGCGELGQIEFPDKITSIGDYAFAMCESLQEISLPPNLQEIGTAAFSGCSNISSLRIEDAASTLYTDSFNFTDSPIATLYLGRTTTLTFHDNKYLNDLTIGPLVKTISAYAFGRCDLLPSVYIPESCENIEEGAFSDCNNLHTIEFEEHQGESCVKIGEGVFRNCINLSNVIFSKYSVNIIESSAFQNCAKLTSVNMPNSLTSIGSNAFVGCDGLESISFGPSLQTIGVSAFESCAGLTALEFPKSLQTIGQQAFKNCSNIEKLSISNLSYRLKIGSHAFSGCSRLTRVGFQCKELGHGAFQGCSNLGNISISAENIKDEAFADCSSLRNVEITIGGQSKIGAIGHTAFENCPIETLRFSLSGKVEKLSGLPFSDIGSIKNLVIYANKYDDQNITTLNKDEFKACKNSLRSLRFAHNPYNSTGINPINICEPFVADSVFISAKINYVDSHGFPDSNAFGIAKVNEYFEGKCDVENAFSGSNLSTAIITNDVGKNAFKDCKNLQLVKLKAEAKYHPFWHKTSHINDGAFAGCSIQNLVISYPDCVEYTFDETAFDEMSYNNSKFYLFGYGNEPAERWDVFKNVIRLSNGYSYNSDNEESEFCMYAGESFNALDLAKEKLLPYGIDCEYRLGEITDNLTIDEDWNVTPLVAGHYRYSTDCAISVNGHCKELMTDFSISFSALSVFAPTSEITCLYLNDSEYNADYYYMNHIEETQPITKYVRLNDFANYKDIIVSSSDEQVVKAETTERYINNEVSGVKFNLYPLSIGTSVITLSSKRYPEISTSFTIYVYDDDPTVSTKKLNLAVGEKAQLEIISDVIPTNRFKWKVIGRKYGVYGWEPSPGDECITIDDNGVVTAIKPGTSYAYFIKPWVGSGGVLPFDSQVCLVTVEDSAGETGITSNQVASVSNVNGVITVKDTPAKTLVSIYDISGLPLYSEQSNGNDITYRPASSGVYIVRIADASYKISIP